MGPQAPMPQGSGNQLGARQWRNPEHCSAEPFIDNDITLPSAWTFSDAGLAKVSLKRRFDQTIEGLPILVFSDPRLTQSFL